MANLVKCKTCGQEIAKSAKVCPHCGAKLKGKHPVLVAIFSIFIFLMFVGIISGKSNEGLETSANEVVVETKEEYIASCVPLAYEDIERNPDSHDGERVKFSGKVIQVAEGWSNGVTYRIATKGNFDDVVYVTYSRGEDESRILDGDTITVYGECDGITTYRALVGKITIPSVKMKFYDQ